jgi:hypothetical protein
MDIVDLAKLIFMLMVIHKGSIIFLSFSTTLLDPSQNIRISSTNNRYVTCHEFLILSPLNLLFSLASFSNVLKPSTTNRKSRGDNGNPYLGSLYSLKKGDVAPFIRIANDIDAMQFITHRTN